MAKTLTPRQREAVEEKKRQLQQVVEGGLSVQELAEQITKRRLKWLEENRHLLREDLPLPEAAFRLIVHEHMNVREGIEMEMVSDNLLKAENRNFCPYLEACRELGLDTKYVCKEIGEPSLVAFFQKINPRLHFSRDYDKIRPHHDCCVEYVEVI